jgi:hypothetical protein
LNSALFSPSIPVGPHLSPGRVKIAPVHETQIRFFDSSFNLLSQSIAMSCPESEQIDAAPQSPRCNTPPQDESNGGAAHAESDAERMETESEADGEKQFDESTGNPA